MTKILIVDDIAQNRYLLTSLFRGSGFETLEAEHGEAALVHADREAVDLVIADILMPVMDGFELCRRMKGDEGLRGIPFIFYTATYTEPKDEAFALSLGAERFLIKPMEPGALLQAVSEVLDEGPKGHVEVPSLSDLVYLHTRDEVVTQKLERKMSQLEEESHERQLTLAALGASEARYSRLFQSMTDAFAETTLEGRILNANPAFQNMLGYSETELQRMTYLDLTPEPWHAVEKDILAQQVLVSGSSKPYQKEYRRKNGTVFPVELRTFLLRDPAGRAEAMWAIVRDITERVHAEKRSLHRQVYLQAVANLASDIQGKTEQDLLQLGLKIAVSLSESRIGLIHFGLTDQLPTPTGAWSDGTLKHGLNGEVIASGFGQEDIWAEALRLRRPMISNHCGGASRGGGTPGQAIPVERVLVVPVKEDGKVCLLMGVGNREYEYGDEDAKLLQVVGSDLWQLVLRKRAELGLVEANATLEARVKSRTAELVALNEEMEAFSYSASHDLQAPLRAILGFGELLDQEVGEGLSPAARGHLLRMRTAATRMGQLIGDLLRLSKVGRSDLVRGPIDLADTARKVLSEFQSGDPERKVALSAPDRLPAEGDPSLLRIVMENLVGNAWKFTLRRDPALIEVGEVQGQEGFHTFFVRDNGAGFPAGKAADLFVPFRRLHSESEFPGTGIGLAIVQRIVRRHGGRVWAEGRAEEGATLLFTLPREGQRPEPAP